MVRLPLFNMIMSTTYIIYFINHNSEKLRKYCKKHVLSLELLCQYFFGSGLALGSMVNHVGWGSNSTNRLLGK